MKLVTVKEICEFLNVKKSTAYLWANGGVIPCYRIGGALRFDMDEIREWVRNSKVTPTNVRTLGKKPSKTMDIDDLIKKAIVGVKGKGYNSPQKGNQTSQAIKGGKVWWMRFTYKGRQIQRSTEATQKKLAEKIHAKVLTEVTEGKWFERLPGSEKTFTELMEKYMREYSAINKAPSTHNRDKSTIKHLIRYFGDHILDEIYPKDVSAYKNARTIEGAAPKTVNKELILMGHAFNLAMKEWEWIRVNPVSMVSKLKVRNLKERWLTYDEEERLLNVSPAWLKEIIVFAVNTGLRQGEILKLTWDRVDLKRRTLTILEQKNGDRDTLPLNEHVITVLTTRKNIRSIKSDHVFFSKAGTPLDARNLLRGYYKARKEAGLEDVRFHDLRHTFATRLVQAGVDIYKVQKLMRHKTPIMTQRYAHHYPESLRDGVEVLDKISTILVQSGIFQ